MSFYIFKDNMDPSDFQSTRTRAGVVEAHEMRGLSYYAFAPASLPPTLAYDAQLVSALSAADSALGELAGIGRRLPNPHVLLGPYVRREAVLSSRIEGRRPRLPTFSPMKRCTRRPPIRAPTSRKCETT